MGSKASIEIVEIPGEEPFILSFGKDAKELTITGRLYVSGQTASYLETAYLLPFLACLYKEVTISAPDTRYDGAWIMTQFQFVEEGGVPDTFTYIMEFKLGSEQLVM
jgi:hypothetical protein